MNHRRERKLKDAPQLPVLDLLDLVEDDRQGVEISLREQVGDRFLAFSLHELVAVVGQFVFGMPLGLQFLNSTKQADVSSFRRGGVFLALRGTDIAIPAAYSASRSQIVASTSCRLAAFRAFCLVQIVDLALEFAFDLPELFLDLLGVHLTEGVLDQEGGHGIQVDRNGLSARLDRLHRGDAGAAERIEDDFARP